LGEFNQCQTQLIILYEEGWKGNEFEFIAYRLLYYIAQNNMSDVIRLLSDLTPPAKNNLAVKHALQVREAVVLNNYHSVFKLYSKTPNKGGFLLEKFMAEQRITALNILVKA
jgi:hypothetical protein